MTAFSNSKPHLKQICEANNSTSIESSPTKSFNPAQMRLRHAIIIAILFASLLALMFIAIGLGQLNISPVRVAQILWNDLLNMLHLRENSAVAWSEGERSAVSLVRAPRIILAIIVGGALAISGATLQALFRNPLVSPDVIGVSSASAFGGVLMIMLQLGFDRDSNGRVHYRPASSAHSYGYWTNTHQFPRVNHRVGRHRRVSIFQRTRLTRDLSS